MSLYPTKTRVALLREVAAGHVILAGDPDTGIRRKPAAMVQALHGRHGRRVTAAIEEMELAGWVERPDRTATWRLTDAGRTVLDKAPLTGDLVCAVYVRGSGTELMIRRERDGNAWAWQLYVNGAHAYGPYWSADDAYDRLKQLGGVL